MMTEQILSVEAARQRRASKKRELKEEGKERIKNTALLSYNLLQKLVSFNFRVKGI